MRIGIDIDGVLVDAERFMIDYGIKFCYENNIPYKLKKDEYYEVGFLNISQEQGMKFWKQCMGIYLTKYPLRDFAKEIIDILKEDNEIYLITARHDGEVPQDLGKTMRELTENWLKENKVSYDKLILTKGSKLPYCIENKIDIMIEDSPKNIKDISSTIPMLCFDCSYNAEIVEDNVTRVYSWYDVLDKIKDMKKGDKV